MTQSTFIPVEPGKLAAVVTYLEMRELPEEPDGPKHAQLSLKRAVSPKPAWYRDLFQQVGREWLWFSRLRLDDAALIDIIHHPKVEIYSLHKRGSTAPKGFLELDARALPDVELAFVGVTADIIGRGAGRYMVGEAVTRARALQANRLWVHTCDFDHPAALALYRKMGFTPFKREIEITDDPRLDGTLPRSAAPQVPVI